MSETIHIKLLDIAVDFDGTCVSHAYPSIGRDIGAVPVLKSLVERGHNLILHTMRCGAMLDAAVEWFSENDIPLYGVAKNPTQHTWTQSPKCYAQVYIDDAALGCPLSIDPAVSDRPFVNWNRVMAMLHEQGIV